MSDGVENQGESNWIKPTIYFFGSEGLGREGRDGWGKFHAEKRRGAGRRGEDRMACLRPLHGAREFRCQRTVCRTGDDPFMWVAEVGGSAGEVVVRVSGEAGGVTSAEGESDTGLAYHSA